MRSSIFKALVTFFALLAMPIASDAHTEESTDSISIDSSTVTASRYDRRIHRYRKNWNAIIPTQHVMQFCGNMGLMSVGIGWDYGKRGQWETQLLFGFIPKYSSNNTKITMTVKQNFIPWSVTMRDRWSLEPLQCGLYLNTVFGHDFWVKQPTKYGSGYYPISTRLRPNIFIGERITMSIPNNRRKYVKSVSFFYELSTNDIYILRLIRAGHSNFWDLFGLSVGIKAQLL